MSRRTWSIVVLLLGVAASSCAAGPSAPATATPTAGTQDWRPPWPPKGPMTDVVTVALINAWSDGVRTLPEEMYLAEGYLVPGTRLQLTPSWGVVIPGKERFYVVWIKTDIMFQSRGMPRHERVTQLFYFLNADSGDDRGVMARPELDAELAADVAQNAWTRFTVDDIGKYPIPRSWRTY